MIATSATDMSISITLYATHAFIGESGQALPLTSTPCKFTSENTIELINLGHALLGDFIFQTIPSSYSTPSDCFEVASASIV